MSKNPMMSGDLPRDKESEQAVLAALLLDDRAIHSVAPRLTSAAFWHVPEGYRALYEAFLGLHKAHQPTTDIALLLSMIKKQGTLTENHALRLLTELDEYGTTSVLNLEHYVAAVEDCHLRREAIAVAERAIQEARDYATPIQDALSHLRAGINTVVPHQMMGMTSMKQGITEILESIRAVHSGQLIKGVMTGFSDLDRLLGGFSAGDLVYLAARPSMGKTALLLAIANNVCLQFGIKTAYFSLEMVKPSVFNRILSKYSAVDLQRLRSGPISEAEMAHIENIATQLLHETLFVDDTRGLTVEAIEAKVETLQAHHDIGLVLVDYIQIMQSSEKRGNRTQEIGDISMGLKTMAGRLGVPVIALSQLSRDVEKRDNKRPQLSDLRDSGQLEQDGDVIMFIYRDDMYNPNTTQPNVAEVIVAKQRNGPLGKVYLGWQKQIASFTELQSATHSSFTANGESVPSQAESAGLDDIIF